jgi:hypothetical protein
LALERAQQAFDHTKYRHRAILVLDRNNRPIGKISQRPPYPRAHKVRSEKTFAAPCISLHPVLSIAKKWEAMLDCFKE